MVDVLMSAITFFSIPQNYYILATCATILGNFACVRYVGWQALVNDKPVVRTVADVAIGSENVDRAVETASGVADSIGEAVSGTGEAIGNVADSVRQSVMPLAASPTS